jgi:hypothetical protein
MLPRIKFNEKQNELSAKISFCSKLLICPSTSASDKKIYAKNIRIFTSLKKRNATLFSKNAIQIPINL